MILKVGSTGEEVKKLQRKLGVTDTGNFGPLTETAVKKWQKPKTLLGANRKTPGVTAPRPAGTSFFIWFLVF